MKHLRLPAAIVLGAALLLTACGDDGGGGGVTTGGGDFDPPTGAEEIVLQVSTGGGFVPIDVNLRQTPEYTLFGDGTVLTLGPQIEIFPPPALTPLMAGHVDEEQIQDVLASAAAIGLTAPASDIDYGTPNVTDLPSTSVTVDAGDGPVTTSVYALGFEDDPQLSDEQRRARDALSDFLASLTDGDPEEYEPEGYAVFVLPYEDAANEPELVQEPVDWPFADLADAPVVDTSECLTITGDDATELREIAAGTNTLTPWVSGGEQYQLVFRSLLPDESSCESVLGVDDETIDHPTGADEVVFRLATGPGGFGPLEAYQTLGIAEVVVYGDGRVVFVADPDAPNSETSLPDVQSVALDDEGLQTVLHLLKKAGLLTDEPDFGEPGLTDQAYTDLTVSAGGVSYDVSVYALGLTDDEVIGDLEPEPVELRNALVRVREQLMDPAFVADLAGTPAEPFDGEGLVVFSSPEVSDEVLDSVTWPVDANLGAECTVLAGDDAARVRELAAETPIDTLWSADGAPFRVGFRPLYPEESGCDDLAPSAVGVGA